jgi:uncharacterized protein (DUF1015 family)
LAKFEPFRALRPPRNMVHLVASRSYISYSRSGLHHKLTTNPYSFVNIINPEFGRTQRTKPNSKKRFGLVRDKFKEFISKGFFLRDEKVGYYLYRQSYSGKVFTGLIGASHCDDYSAGIIKKHEHTLTQREKVFEKYLEITGINAEPVLLTHPDSLELETLYSEITSQRAEYDFMTANGAVNELWLVQNPAQIKKIKNVFSDFHHLYIADGHHRCASSALLAETMRKNNPGHNGKEAYNYFLSYIIPEHNLEIMPFSRMVSVLGSLGESDFLEQLSQQFEVIQIKSEFQQNIRYNSIVLYLAGIFYELRPLGFTFDKTHPVERLDVSILSNNILGPLLGIKDPRTDPRLHFEGGQTTHRDILKWVDQGRYKAAFFLHPVSIEQLKAVADAGLYMPPKSTWIEPKLRSGMILFSIDNDSL